MTEQSNSSPEQQINQLIEALTQSTVAQQQTAAAVLELATQVAHQNEINAALLDVIADGGEDEEEDHMPATLNRRQ